ncbi:MAG: MCP four helix bundle domain-containing protein, partial [Syntrophobacteraceae bacterium]
MNWFYNLKIGTKLISAFIVVAMIGGLVGYIGVTKLHSIDKSYSELIDNNLKPLGDIASASVDYQITRVNLRDLLADATAKEMEQHIAVMNQTEKNLEEELAIFEKSVKTEDVKREFDSLKQSIARFEPVKDRMIRLIQDGKKDEATSVMRGEALAIAKSIEDSINKLFQMKIDHSEKESNQNTTDANSAIKFLLSVAGIGVLLAIVFGFFISRVISNPIRSLASAADKLALGDVNVSIEANTRDEIGMLSQSFKKVIENIQDASMAAEKVAEGDIQVEVKVRSENDLLGKGLNSMLDTIRSLLSETEKLTKATQDGKLDTRGNAAMYKGAWNELVQSVNGLIDAFVAPINVTAEYVDRISKGDIPPKITDVYKGDFNEIKNNLNSCIDAVNALVADANALEQAAVEGKLATRADATKHQGDYRKIVEGVNNTLDAVIGPLNVAAEYVDQISKGNIPPAITDTYKGDFNEIKNNLNATVKMMNELLAETDKIIQAAANGELDKRADANLFVGGWNKLVSGVNDTITNIVDPLMVTADYVEKVSKGVIPPTI